MPGVIFMDNL